MSDTGLGQFPTVVLDPPWPYPEGFKGKPLPYPSMALDAIAALPVPSVLKREGYVFMWTTNRYLPDAFRILAGWGCTHRQTVTWCKPKANKLGGMFAATSEFVVVAQRIGPRSHAHGSATRRLRADSSWFAWPRPNRHSEKPQEFFDIVEKVSPGPYLEIFARKQRPGWTCVGNEIDGRDVFDALRPSQEAA